nr:substrate-binding domain-containing protein [Streptomyces sp. LBUM 1477]
MRRAGTAGPRRPDDPPGAGRRHRRGPVLARRRSQVTGVCAFNDDVAMSVLAGLRHLGLEAPRDMAVIGVDDTPAAAVSWPPLTSVVQDLPGIAELYANSVRSALDGTAAPASTVEPNIRLAVRESA